MVVTLCPVPEIANGRAVLPEEQLIVNDSPLRLQATMECQLTCEDRDRARRLRSPPALKREAADALKRLSRGGCRSFTCPNTI
jgi:hypothetical protein